jgi:hypothetical protein
MDLGQDIIQTGIGNDPKSGCKCIILVSRLKIVKNKAERRGICGKHSLLYLRTGGMR